MNSVAVGVAAEETEGETNTVRVNSVGVRVSGPVVVTEVDKEDDTVTERVNRVVVAVFLPAAVTV